MMNLTDLPLGTYNVSTDISDRLKLAMQIWYCLIAIIGVGGNSLTIASILLNKKLRSIPNVYIASLAFADLVVTGAVAPFTAWQISQRSVSVVACRFIGALNTAMLGNTIFNLTAIGVNRYVLIVKGTKTYTRLYTRRNVIISVIVLWMLPVFLILPAILGFGEFGFNHMMGACIFVADDTTTYIYVQSILHGLCVGPCLIVTLFCYLRIILYFRHTQRQLQKSVSSCSKDSGVKKMADELEEYELSSGGTSNNNGGQVVRLKRSRASQRVVMNLCTVFAVFMFCWSPIVGVYTVDFHSVTPPSVSHIFLAVATMNSCLNIFIYAGMNRAFRKTYKYILTLQCEKINTSL